MARFAGKRLRAGRYSETGRIYLLTTVTLKRAPLFTEWYSGRCIARALKTEHDARRVHSIAWVVMPDHLHWLFALQHGELSSLACRIKAASALAINAHLGRTGPVWQKGFHDRALRREEDLKAVARYVVHNPVRAGLVARIDDYPLWDAMWL